MMEEKGGDGGVLAARFFQQRNNAFPESRGRKGRGRWEVQEHGENAPACISRRVHANIWHSYPPLVRRGGLVYSIREESDTVRIRLGDNPCEGGKEG